MRDGHEAGGSDAVQQVGLLQAAFGADAGLQHEGPQLSQPHVGQLFRVVARYLGLHDFDLSFEFCGVHQ